MAFELGGMADKLGNRYEGRWVARQLLRLLNEGIESVTVELIGPDERGVDLLVVGKDGIRRLQQCKARCGSRDSWSIPLLKSKGILDHMREHLARDSRQEFVLVTAVPFKTFPDICNSARNSPGNARDFFQYQIQAVSEERRKTFREFCHALGLVPEREKDLETAHDYLRRIEIHFEADDRQARADLVTLAGLQVTGEPETALSVLLTYAENDKYRQPIYADELRRYLTEHHNIHPKQLSHDHRIAPAVERLRQEFSYSIGPGLIDGRLIPREETARIIENLKNNRDVVVHGAAGLGKSGVLFALTEHLRRQNIPYLPVRLDRRIPQNNARRFGEDIGLPDSPALCLAGLAGKRLGVLILDQLDAIRWTASHSSAAMEVCTELVRQISALRRSGKSIVIVFACRTFDLENDPEIKRLLSSSGESGIVKIAVQALNNEQVKTVIGPDFAALSGEQKRILSCPHNLAIWMELKKEEAQPFFRTATGLMRRFWESRRRNLEHKAGISTEKLGAFLTPLLDYMEDKGEISAPAFLAAGDPTVRDALVSFAILQSNAGRISFCHQRYLDYLIAERLLLRIYEETGSMLDWLGPKEKQSLFRREQLRQALAMLEEESPADFFATVLQVLGSGAVRFHLKHLVLELIGQMGAIRRDIGEYCLGLFSDNYWQEHVLETVFFGHHPWVIYLLETGIIQNWLDSEEEQEVNRALRLLRSVAEQIPDQVTEILAPFVDNGGDWPGRILNALCWKEADDSKQMFELRLQLARTGHVKDFVDWKSLCANAPLRAIRLIEAVLSTWNVDEDISERGKGRLERWYDRDLQALNNAVQQCPAETWDLLIGHIERLTNFQVTHDDPRLERWRGSLFSSGETDIARGVVDLVVLAGQTLATGKPDELVRQTTLLKDSVSPVVQEIILAVYVHLPASHADTAISWLIEDTARFRLGPGYHEPEWMPAVRLIKALFPHCSERLFRRLEEAIIYYHAPEEKRYAEYYLKGWRDGYFGHYWGKTQYFLLPALDATRIQPATVDLIRVLKRKFKHYAKKRFLRGGTSFSGWVGSKLDPNLEKISDRAWLKIVISEKVTEHGKHKGIQVDSGSILKTSIRQFAGSLGRIAKRFPERFGRLALRFPDNVHPSYVSAILDGFAEKEPGKEVPETEKSSWHPASVKTIEAVLEKYMADDDRETAMSFCRLIAKRADETWSDKTIARLVHYARNHPDLETGKLNIHCDKSCDEATVEILFRNTINCVRGVAAGAIGQLLWDNQGWMEQVRPAIESLIHDPHPAVRMAAIEAIEPVLNTDDRDLAVQWFCEACKDDLRVAASRRAAVVFNYTIPSHVDKVGPVIQRMVFSPLDDVAYEGARQVTARWLFHGFFKQEFERCRMGTVPQRKGVANVAASLLPDSKYSPKCQELLRQFMNDLEKEVRDELRSMFRNSDLVNDPEYAAFTKEYIKSQAFADDPDHFVWSLKDVAGGLIPVADAIFTVCEEFSTTLQEKTRDIGSRYPYFASEVSSILLRLYEQAQGERNRQVADRCLGIWDLLFENRVGRTIELTRAIEQ